MSSISPLLRATRSIAPMPPQAIPWTRSASSYWMLLAAIIGHLDRAGAILDAFEDSTLAFPQFVEEIMFHSKASVAWSSEDVLTPLLFQEHRRFSSLFLTKSTLTDDLTRLVQPCLE